MKQILLLLLLVSSTLQLSAQDKEDIRFKMTLDEVIELAQKQSLEAFRAKNMYLADYWSFRSYKAEMLPSLTLQTTPYKYYTGTVSIETEDKGEIQQYKERYSSVGGLSLSQPFKYTGGNFSVNSGLEYSYDNSRSKGKQYNYKAQPIVSFSYQQDLSSTMYNELKWKTTLEPLAFEKAKLDYITNAERIAGTSVNYFFNLVRAQINLNISETNFSNADTLYRIAKGRFEIGTITQDELLDLELGLLNAKTNLTRNKLALQRAQKRLNTFLMMDQNIVIECIIPEGIPSHEIDYNDALSKASLNNPLAKQITISNLQAEQRVAETQSRRGFTGNLNINYGLTKSALIYDDVYIDPDDYQDFQVRLTVPILDWGVRKGAYLQAKSNKEVTRLANEQDWTEFEQDLLMNIMSFNIQDEQVAVAAKADTVAQMGYKVTKQRFFIDKVDVIRLNEARKSLEEAKAQYIDALRTYWNYYYTIRQQTLYDFDKAQPLMADFEQILEETNY